MVEGAAPVPEAAASRWIHRLAAPAAIAACVMVFYWAPLTSSSASIQREAADLALPVAKVFLRSAFAPQITVLDSLCVVRLPATRQS